MDYLIKFGLFSIWTSLLYLLTDSIVSVVIGYISSMPYIPWLQSFGIITGFNLFFSIVVSCFISKKMLNFWMSS